MTCMDALISRETGAVSDDGMDALISREAGAVSDYNDCHPRAQRRILLAEVRLEDTSLRSA